MLEQSTIFNVFIVEKHVINNHVVPAFGHGGNGRSHALQRSLDYVSGSYLYGLAIYALKNQPIMVLESARRQHCKEVVHLNMQKWLLSNALNSLGY